MGSGFGLSALSNVGWFRLDFRDPRSSAHLLQQILQEIISGALSEEPIAIHLSFLAVYLENLRSWDYILWSYRKHLSRLKLWIKSYRGEHGEQPNDKEKERVRGLMPMVCSVGLLVFDTRRE